MHAHACKMESVLQPYQSRCHSEFQPGCPFVKPTEVCSVEERKARRTLEEQSAHVYAHGDLIYQDDKRGSISWNCQLPYYVHEWVSGSCLGVRLPSLIVSGSLRHEFREDFRYHNSKFHDMSLLQSHDQVSQDEVGFCTLGCYDWCVPLAPPGDPDADDDNPTGTSVMRLGMITAPSSGNKSSTSLRRRTRSSRSSRAEAVSSTGLDSARSAWQAKRRIRGIASPSTFLFFVLSASCSRRNETKCLLRSRPRSSTSSRGKTCGSECLGGGLRGGE